MRESRVVAAARLLSFVIAGLSIAVGALYYGPEVLVRRPPSPGQDNIVVIIEHVFPLWPLIFALTGAALAVAAYLRRGLAVTHSLVVVTWVFYGLCLILAPIRSIPPSPILVGVIALGIAAINHAAAKLWAAMGVT